jgi:hypothetical protein
MAYCLTKHWEDRGIKFLPLLLLPLFSRSTHLIIKIYLDKNLPIHLLAYGSQCDLYVGQMLLMNMELMNHKTICTNDH